MDDNYLRQRTDEILRERIRLGMTGGEGVLVGGRRRASRRMGRGEGGYGTHQGALKGWKTRRSHMGMGEYTSGEELVDIVKSVGSAYGGKFTERERKWARTVERYNRNPPKTEKGMRSFEMAQDKLYRSLSKKKHLGKVDARMLEHIKGDYGRASKMKIRRSGSKSRVVKGRKPRKDCTRLKRKYNQEICEYRKSHPRSSLANARHAISTSYPGSASRMRRKEHGRLKCRDQKNEWLAYLCRYRNTYRDDLRYQGRDGQRLLMHEAAIAYRNRKHRKQFGPGEEIEGLGYGEADMYNHIY